MALTLAEAKKHASNPQEAAIITELAAGSLLQNLPFREVQGNGLFWKREESLGNVGFRNFNSGYSESYATIKQHSEALRLFGGDIRVDRAIVDLEGPEARAYQIQAKTRAMRLSFEALFIQGNSNGSPAEFDGLAKRLPAADYATNSQVIRNGTSNVALNLDKLDEVIDAVDAQGGSKFLVMSKSARRALSKIARTSVQIDIMRDEFGQQQMVYAGLPVLELDRFKSTKESKEEQNHRQQASLTFHQRTPTIRRDQHQGEARKHSHTSAGPPAGVAVAPASPDRTSHPGVGAQTQTGLASGY